ncbi:MAG: TetR/AcrR family transcriptional regulator C-terminal domain-containing protein [Clostridia bacterium]|nr:TetR/AcrR family transcriptional regulator C-terminal domain-containing protein [Clostridia bacterium]
MNVKNNMRRRESIRRIENTFMTLLQTKDVSEITVAEICKKADINRSTFYANFLDIYDLAEKIKEHLEAELNEQFDGMTNVVGSTFENTVHFFTHIKENQLFYRSYFKLGHDKNFQLINYDINEALISFNNKNIEYHVEFFRNGLNAVIKLWLNNGCKESPVEIAEVIRKEYSGRKQL